MIDKFNVRTDLALEEKERFESDDVEISGVVLEEHYDEQKEIRITMVKIETEKGARTMGKPVGLSLIHICHSHLTYLSIRRKN